MGVGGVKKETRRHQVMVGLGRVRVGVVGGGRVVQRVGARAVGLWIEAE